MPIAFYDDNAATYAARSRQAPEARLSAFADLLPVAGAVLELGCGAGDDSAWLIERGFAVTPSDGSAAMACTAEARLCRPVRVMPFAALADVALYDGVWANACLLHVPRPDLADVLSRIHRALRQPGLFYASFKTGGEEGEDRFGRYYNRPSPQWLKEIYLKAGFSAVQIEAAAGGGYDGEPTDWLHVWATKGGGEAL